MSRYYFAYRVKYANASYEQRPRTVVKVVPCIAIYGKKYGTAGQAATTIAWLITSNLGAKFSPANKNWSDEKIDGLYRKARRRVLPICERLLK